MAFRVLVARPALRSAGADNAAEFSAFEQRQLTVAKWALLSVFLTGLLGFWLQIAAVTGMPLDQALGPENVAGVLFGTRYGLVWLARVVLILFLAWAL